MHEEEMKQRCRETGKGLEVEVRPRESDNIFEVTHLCVTHRFEYRGCDEEVHVVYKNEPFDKFWNKLRREIREQKKYVDMKMEGVLP